MMSSRTVGGCRHPALREIKMLLLERLEKSGIDLQELVEWVYDEYGIRVRRRWEDVRRVLLSCEVEPQALAVFMLEHGIEVPEEEWIKVLRKHGIKV